MTSRTISWVATAAMAVGGVAFAQQTDQGSQAGQAGQSSQTGTSAQDQSSKQGQQEGMQGMEGMRGGQHIDREIVRQIQDFRKDPNTASDKLFLLMAGINGQTEVELAQKAQYKTQDQNLKQLAQKIVQDHQTANQQLQQTAQQLGVQIPQGVPELQRQEIDLLTQLNGKDFDQAFVGAIEKDHARDVTAYRIESQIGKDQNIKQWASQQLPTLQAHLQQADQCAVALGVPSSMEATQAGATMGQPAQPAQPGQPGQPAQQPAQPGQPDQNQQQPGQAGQPAPGK